MWRKVFVILFLSAVLALWLDMWNSAKAQLPTVPAGAGDPETEQIIVDPNPPDYDRFGYPGKLQGEHVFVTAPRDDDPAYAGEVRQFARNEGEPGGWGLVEALGPLPVQAGASFGSWIDLDGEQLIIGAEGENAAYIFELDPRNPGAWKQQARLAPSGVVDAIKFGHHVALAGDVAVVGAPSLYEYGLYGAVYVFERDAVSGTWNEMGKLTGANSWVGHSVATDGELILVGSADYDAGGVVQAGGVLVFAKETEAPTCWTRIGALSAPDPQEYASFGRYFAMSGPWVAVLERNRERPGGGRGVAYLFQRNGENPADWPLVATLVPEDTSQFNALGISVAVSPQGDRVAAGGWIYGEGDTLPGTVYVFDRDAGGQGAWGQVLALTAEDDSYSFGYGIDIDASGVMAIGDPSSAEPSGKLHIVCINDDLEPNDSFASATPIEEEWTTGLQVCGGGDVDIFLLEVESGQDILAQLHFTHEAGDLQLALFSPDQVLLAQSDSKTDDETIAFGVTQPGTYYLVVQGTALAANRYELRARLLDLHFMMQPISLRVSND